MINYGWITIASILSVTTSLKYFEVELYGYEVLWAVGIIVVAYAIFYLSAIIYGHFFYGIVFAFYNFCLFLKYIDLIMENGKTKILYPFEKHFINSNKIS
jgi:uncharacterized membrane protein YdbT with pleckstrin-like domain